ncbi:hypothetical protein C1646_819792 [Rhizophagus diaphanus]|nr:hypothetical protein C1646_819792 [Rhizophagus diaphanus] [Rhizophagus sp. MUCL 43196]
MDGKVSSKKIEEFEESGTEEFERSCTEEFESSSIEEFEGNDFILKNRFKWIPYNKFKNIEYLNEGGFGTIYKAIWLKNNEDEKEVILKCHKNLNENLIEFLKEWEYHASVLISNDIINLFGFTEDQNTLKYMQKVNFKDQRIC